MWRACLVLLAALWSFGASAQADTDCRGPEGFSPHGRSTQLAVFLHAFRHEGRDLCPAIAALLGTPAGADADVLAPDLPFGMLSRARPEDVLAALIKRVDDQWKARQDSGHPYQSLLLVGHSMGGLFARKLYLAGQGEHEEAAFEDGLKAGLRALGAQGLSKPRDWAAVPTRIVLMAGINRGWSISHHMSLQRGLEMGLGVWTSRLVQAVGGDAFTVMSAHRGSPFITQMRLQWLAHRRHIVASGRPDAHVVQLLGTQDDLVPPSDNIDAFTGRDFSYIEVPRSGHVDVIQMDAQTPVGSARRAKFVQALSLQPGESPLRPVALANLPQPDPSVDRIVFVIHGIRDEGFWTERIGVRIQELAARQGSKVALETSSYGYFPMLSFLVPGARQEKVEWLMDRYTEALARYPNAGNQVSFVGHSHGTYLLKKALEDYPAMKVGRVVLAGSVIRKDHDWAPLLQSGRVGGVLNLVASSDWVVAWLPNALEKLGLQDVGGAGHYGFQPHHPGLLELPPPGRFVRGGHSAALDEAWWDSIAGYVVKGTLEVPDMPREAEHGPWVAAGAAVAPLLWLLAALVVAGLFWLILRAKSREWKKTLAVTGLAGLLLLVLTQY